MTDEEEGEDQYDAKGSGELQSAAHLSSPDWLRRPVDGMMFKLSTMSPWSRPPNQSIHQSFSHVLLLAGSARD